MSKQTGSAIVQETREEGLLEKVLSDETRNDTALQDVTENLNRLMHAGLYGLESPIERAMELIGDKYSFQIIHILCQFERQRFVELEQQIPGISPRTLSARLKHLEKFRLINRNQFPTIPPKVEYTLTERGKDLAATLKSLETWVNCWYPYTPGV